jgi:hypothetical protein
MGKPYNILFLVLFGFLFQTPAIAQQNTVKPPMPTLGQNDTIAVYVTLLPDGTWVPTSALPDVECVAQMPKWMRKEQKKWSRLRNAVYVTYPYALAASRVINDINLKLEKATNEQVRKQIIKAQESQLKAAFGEKITNLSVYQGKVLMKLINRETGDNCYDILKEYKGGMNARFWQTVAFVFGGNLKQPYQPKGEDAEMEGIVLDVEKIYNLWKS